MIVYNTATVGDVVPGIYYNNGVRWVAAVVRAGSSPGEMQYWNGINWVAIAPGIPGQKLMLNASGVPTWSN
jgi:hypothetical protein